MKRSLRKGGGYVSSKPAESLKPPPPGPAPGARKVGDVVGVQVWACMVHRTWANSPLYACKDPDYPHPNCGWHEMDLKKVVKP